MRCLTPAILLNIRHKPRAEIGVTVFQIGTAYDKKEKEKLVFFVFFGWLLFLFLKIFGKLHTFFPSHASHLWYRTSYFILYSYLSSVRYASAPPPLVKITLRMVLMRLMVLMETCESE